MALLAGPSVLVVALTTVSGADDMSAAETTRFCVHYRVVFDRDLDSEEVSEVAWAHNVRGMLAVAPSRLADPIKAMDLRTYGPQDKSGMEAQRDLDRLTAFATRTCGPLR